jgi:hypothetical protein
MPFITTNTQPSHVSRSTTLLRGAAVAGLLAALALPTTASAYYDYRVHIDIGADGIPARNLWADGDTPQSLHAEMAGLDSISSAIGSSVADHGGTVRAGATLNDIGVLNQTLSVTSDLTYTFQLLAQPGNLNPSGSVPVSVVASAIHLNPGSLNSSEAKFSLQLAGQQGYLIYKDEYTYRARRDFTMFSVNQVVNLTPGALYTVYLSAHTLAWNTTASYGTVSPTWDEIIVDPVFTIDPAYASQYQLVGIPAAAVPEPTSTALLIAGLLIMALAIQRRQ